MADDPSRTILDDLTRRAAGLGPRTPSLTPAAETGPDADVDYLDSLDPTPPAAPMQLTPDPEEPASDVQPIPLGPPPSGKDAA